MTNRLQELIEWCSKEEHKDLKEYKDRIEELKLCTQRILSSGLDVPDKALGLIFGLY